MEIPLIRLPQSKRKDAIIVKFTFNVVSDNGFHAKYRLVITTYCRHGGRAEIRALLRGLR